MSVDVSELTIAFLSAIHPKTVQRAGLFALFAGKSWSAQACAVNGGALGVIVTLACPSTSFPEAQKGTWPSTIFTVPARFAVALSSPSVASENHTMCLVGRLMKD